MKRTTLISDKIILTNQLPSSNMRAMARELAFLLVISMFMFLGTFGGKDIKRN